MIEKGQLHLTCIIPTVVLFKRDFMSTMELYDFWRIVAAALGAKGFVGKTVVWKVEDMLMANDKEVDVGDGE